MLVPKEWNSVKFPLRIRFTRGERDLLLQQLGADLIPASLSAKASDEEEFQALHDCFTMAELVVETQVRKGPWVVLQNGAEAEILITAFEHWVFYIKSHRLSPTYRAGATRIYRNLKQKLSRNLQRDAQY